MAVQRHRITPGRLLRFLEILAAEDDPCAGIIRYLTHAERHSKLTKTASGELLTLRATDPQPYLWTRDQDDPYAIP
jgi:hypothetical protein